MSNVSKGKRSSGKLKSMGDHDAFLCRITKSLYYSRLPMTDRLSLPVTEFAAELFTEVRGGLTLERLDVEEAGRISRNACVSPCSLVLALLYLERLKDCNPEYLRRVAPSELFLVSLMVASKFLNDDGEEDEVFNAEWAKSGDSTVARINSLEKDFLRAIDWLIFVRDGDFWERLRKLEKDIAYREARKRGWFSYTELSCLMENVQVAALVHAFVGVSSVCLATYAAGLATLVASVLLASQLPGTSLVSRQTHFHRVANSTDPRLATTHLRLDEAPTRIQDGPMSSEFFHPDTDEFTLNDTPVKRSVATTGRENLSEEHASWKWWLSSTMTRLPEYSKILDEAGHRRKSHVLARTNYDNVDNNGSGSGSSSNGNDDQDAGGGSWKNEGTYMSRSENLIAEIDWKETVSRDLYMGKNDWRYYATRISLGHGH